MEPCAIDRCGGVENEPALALDRVDGWPGDAGQRFLQATEGLSLDAQKERLEACCRAEERTLAAIYKDAGISASSRRSGFQGAMSALSTTSAAIV